MCYRVLEELLLQDEQTSQNSTQEKPQYLITLQSNSQCFNVKFDDSLKFDDHPVN